MRYKADITAGALKLPESRLTETSLLYLPVAASVRCKMASRRPFDSRCRHFQISDG
jgi:hypothetical protein